MRKSMLIAVLMILISGLVQAQTRTQTKARARAQKQSDQESPVQVYLLAGLGHPTGGNNRFQFGGGVEAFLYKGLSIGGELSHGTGVNGIQGTGFQILSANGAYHFLKGVKASKFDPFAIGGYTRFLQNGADANAANFGGGLNYWVAKGVGVRFDLRDHVASGGSFIGLRGGVVFSF